jgi:hypothetical protein
VKARIRRAFIPVVADRGVPARGCHIPYKIKIRPDCVLGPNSTCGRAFKCKHPESRVLTESYEIEPESGVIVKRGILGGCQPIRTAVIDFRRRSSLNAYGCTLIFP